MLLAPALAVYSLVMLAPMLWSLGLTFFKGNPVFGFKPAGFDNFTKFFTDPRAGEAVWFTLKYALAVTVGQVILGYLLALLYVFALRRASALIRTLVFFPVVLPTVAVALLFKNIFRISPGYGLVNSALDTAGLPVHDFLNQPGSAFWVLVAMDLWRSMGFYAVLLYAGLVDIPTEMLESARMDGATGIRLVRHIVLPLSLPVLLASVIFSINGTLKVFDSVLGLTNGGPAFATTPLTVYMYQTSFQYSDYGYGSTLALMLTALCLIVTIAIFRSQKRDLTTGGTK
jgi:multiple sugar transport system permease protein/raffinose/stachyose/melibiose transport system permease protein